MKETVLIVDDNSTNLYMLEALLKANGFIVSTAKNGREALDFAHANPPDIVISDILMPVMDGYKLCHEWKSDAALKHIPFVFFTATYTDPRDEVFALSLGADRFILKPQEPAELLLIVQEILKTRSQVREAIIKPLGEEMEYFRQYNEILFSKLEKKMLALETSNKNLSLLEERYRLSFEYATDIICTVDTNLLISSISPGLRKILGYLPAELTGKSIADLEYIFTEESLAQAKNDIRLTLSGKQVFSAIYQCITQNGDLKYIEVNLSPTLKENKVAGIIAVARDIDDRKKAENKIQLLLHEKSILLKEAHHRIKNNMNTLMSLLSLQLDAQSEPAYISVLKDAMSRLETMRVLYDKLYLSENQSEMPISDYLSSLVTEIIKMFSNDKLTIKTGIAIDNFMLGVQLLIPVGIIITELITNAMKYAFKGRNTGSITVNGTVSKGRAVLLIADDGIGIPDSADNNASGGFGLTLINMLIQQINGSIKREQSNGTKYIIEFPF